jgi:lipopolysaccharide transport system permease protein
MVRGLWGQRELIRRLTVQEVIGRYKGSYFGLLWTILTPLLMLAVFTFVFGIVFKAKWGVSAHESRLEFALTLFCGLIAFNLFSECFNRSPGLILGYPNYVKRVVFPLEILPVNILLSSLFHALVSLFILLLGISFIMDRFPWTVIYLPLVLFPLVCLSLGLSWFVASVGVFIRDVGNMTGFLTTLLFFGTPIFYPITALPGRLQTVIRLNPLTLIAEDLRRIMIWNLSPDWHWYGLSVSFSLGVLLVGYAWFMQSKRAFADVM